MRAGKGEGEGKQSYGTQGAAGKGLRLIGQTAEVKALACPSQQMLLRFLYSFTTQVSFLQPEFFGLNLIILGICSIFMDIQDLCLSHWTSRWIKNPIMCPFMVHEQYVHICITVVTGRSAGRGNPAFDHLGVFSHRRSVALFFLLD